MTVHNSLNRRRSPGLVFLILLPLLLPACGGGGGGSSSDPAAGGSGGSGGSGSSAAFSLSYAIGLAGYLDGNSGANSPSNPNGWEMVRDAAFDSAGNIYLVGGTTAADFPTTPGAHDRSFGAGGATTGNQGYTDAFITKLDSAGNIVWSTFLGGDNYDRAYAVELDNAGNVYVAGRAGEGFPVLNALQSTFGGDSAPNAVYGQQDGFVAKFSAAGVLQWATYIGSTGLGFIRDIAVEPDTGIIHVAGYMAAPLSSTFITGDAYRSTFQGSYDGIYLRLSSDGQTVLYGTYLGGGNGSSDFFNPSVQIDSLGNAVVQAYTDATDIPITTGHYQTSNRGKLDIVVYKIAADKTVTPCTYYGGSDDEDMETHQLGLDNLGNIYISGRTKSSNLPTTAGALQTAAGSGSDGFIAKISADCTSLLAATYLGGAGYDEIEGLAVSAANGFKVYVSGTTRSSNTFGGGGGALQPNLASSGIADSFLAVLDTDLSQLLYGTYVGGSQPDQGRSLAVDGFGNVVIGGQTQSADYPTKNAFDAVLNATYGGSYIRLDLQ